MRIPKEDVMSDLYQSLSHSRWDGKYHVVFGVCDLEVTILTLVFMVALIVVYMIH